MNTQEINKEYADRDIMSQGKFYTKHVSAMTGEKLHSKSAIAAELAHRDMEIARLRKEVERLKNTGYWLIYFEDDSMKPRIYASEEIAREQHRIFLLNWSCHLFSSVSAIDQFNKPLEAK